MSDIEAIKAEITKLKLELEEKVKSINEKISKLEVSEKAADAELAPVEESCPDEWTDCSDSDHEETGSVQLKQVQKTKDELDEAYAARLESYEDNWPEDHCKTPASLARAGYSYKGPEDLVRCDSCSSSFWKWKPSENPWEEHAFYGPKCPFLIGSRGENFIQQVHKKYHKARLDSFKKWPADHCMKAEDLAEAGFTFKGPGDAVSCGSCEATLSKWQPGDEAWEEHAYRSPHCEFVKLAKSEYFADTAEKRKYEKYLATFKDWPSANKVRPELMAQVGYSFIGPEDKVWCRTCDTTLSKWVKDDDPWREHAYYDPECPRLRRIRGDGYVEKIQDQKAIKLAKKEIAERRKKREEAGLEGFDEFEVAALKRHNELRAKHGSPPLKPDRALCNLASDWARQMARQGCLSHRPGSGSNQGENCFYTSSTKVSGPQLAIDSIDSCYSEIKYYQFGYGGFSYSTGHFTAIVWRATTKMGIGHARGHNGTFVCMNYLPTGNVTGKYNENVKPLGTAMPSWYKPEVVPASDKGNKEHQYEERLATYGDWPAEHAHSPRALARAGFSYVGPDDTVVCKECNQHLAKWLPHEEAWEGHATYAPECSFVLREKGADFVKKVLAKNNKKK